MSLVVQSWIKRVLVCLTLRNEFRTFNQLPQRIQLTQL